MSQKGQEGQKGIEGPSEGRQSETEARSLWERANGLWQQLWQSLPW